MAGSMVYRLRADKPDADHMATFRGAMGEIQEISDERGFNHIAGFHGAPGQYCWHHQMSRRAPGVRAQLFLPWHRAYLRHLELALQDRVNTAALPWWDWSRDGEIPEAYALNQIDGQPNPLFDFHIRVPSAGLDRRTFRNKNPQLEPLIASPQQIESLLANGDYSSFADELENMHDIIHGYVGGDLGRVATAAFDPVFFAHHCMIDRIWYLWQMRHGINTIQQELLDHPLEPFSMLVGDVLNVQSLGYEYADTATDIPLNN